MKKQISRTNCDTYEFEWTEEVYNKNNDSYSDEKRFTTIFFTANYTEGCRSTYYEPAEQTTVEITIRFIDGDLLNCDAEQDAENEIIEMLLEDCEFYN